MGPNEAKIKVSGRAGSLQRRIHFLSILTFEWLLVFLGLWLLLPSSKLIVPFCVCHHITFSSAIVGFLSLSLSPSHKDACDCI